MTRDELNLKLTELTQAVERLQRRMDLHETQQAHIHAELQTMRKHKGW